MTNKDDDDDDGLRRLSIGLSAVLVLDFSPSPIGSNRGSKNLISLLTG